MVGADTDLAVNRDRQQAAMRRRSIMASVPYAMSLSSDWGFSRRCSMAGASARRRQWARSVKVSGTILSWATSRCRSVYPPRDQAGLGAAW